jgi:hypothetical protein
MEKCFEIITQGCILLFSQAKIHIYKYLYIEYKSVFTKIVQRPSLFIYLFFLKRVPILSADLIYFFIFTYYNLLHSITNVWAFVAEMAARRVDDQKPNVRGDGDGDDGVRSFWAKDFRSTLLPLTSYDPVWNTKRIYRRTRTTTTTTINRRYFYWLCDFIQTVSVVFIGPYDRGHVRFGFQRVYY